jgi:hypothetical protein
MNRDTLYGGAVYELDAGPITITLPDPGQRFMSMQVINEDEYTTGVIYDPGSQRFTREQVGTRYVVVAVRTDSSNPEDLKQAASTFVFDSL